MGFLDGKIAVVTRGNRGIGRGIADALAREGAKVAIAARSLPNAERAAGELGHGARGYACDVRAYEAVQRLFSAVTRDFGGCDILVNNAGIGVFSPVAEMDPDDW